MKYFFVILLFVMFACGDQSEKQQGELTRLKNKLKNSESLKRAYKEKSERLEKELKQANTPRYKIEKTGSGDKDSENIMSLDEPIPVGKYMDIDSIWVENKEICFYSEDGEIRLFPEDGNISIMPANYSIAKKRCNFPEEKIPKSLIRTINSTYINPIWHFKNHRLGEYILIRQSGEGAYYCGMVVVDLGHKLVYDVKDYSYEQCAADKLYIYLCGPTGIRKINKNSLQTTDYSIYPYFNEHTSFLECEDEVWLASDKLCIQRIDKNDQTVKLMQVSDILSMEYEHTLFSNIVQKDNYIYFGVGCRIDGGYPQDGKNFLLIFDKGHGIWKNIKIPDHFGVIKLFTAGERIIIAGQLLVGEEGGGETTYGGLAYLDEKQDSIHILDKISPKEIVTYLEETEKGLFLETFEVEYDFHGIISEYIFDIASNTITKTKEFKGKRDELRNWGNIRFYAYDKTPDYEKNRARLKEIKIIPKIIAKTLPAGTTELIF